MSYKGSAGGSQSLLRLTEHERMLRDEGQKAGQGRHLAAQRKAKSGMLRRAGMSVGVRSKRMSRCETESVHSELGDVSWRVILQL